MCVRCVNCVNNSVQRCTLTHRALQSVHNACITQPTAESSISPSAEWFHIGWFAHHSHTTHTNSHTTHETPTHHSHTTATHTLLTHHAFNRHTPTHIAGTVGSKVARCPPTSACPGRLENGGPSKSGMGKMERPGSPTGVCQLSATTGPIGSQTLATSDNGKCGMQVGRANL